MLMIFNGFTIVISLIDQLPDRNMLTINKRRHLMIFLDHLITYKIELFSQKTAI